MELFDYADSRLGSSITCSCPSTTTYEVENLINHREQNQIDSGTAYQLPLLVGSRGGFMAESFVRPPADIIITLPYQISLAAVIINPCIRLGQTRVASIFTQGNKQRWEFAGRLVWSTGIGSGARSKYGLHNTDVQPEMIQQAKTVCLRHPDASTWSSIQTIPASALHFVKSIRVSITSMHDLHALGLGGIEIWGQPSQRMPESERVRAWEYAYQALKSKEHIETPMPANPKTTSEYPAEFIDSITQNLMTDPVILPSGVRCDRSTIARHLLGHQTDPFTGLALNYDQVKPDLALKLRIQRWVDHQ
ncbi:U-box domain-containing protein [Coemansia spiralis]|nr:U-box domain-containing protein [Coemansia spiralis]